MKTMSSDEQGYVLVLTLFMLLILTVIGVAAIQMSSIEVEISGNNRKMVEEFYLAEGALVTVLEKSNWWLGQPFLSGDKTTAGWSNHLDVDMDGKEDVLVEVRCIERSNAKITGLSPAANHVPADRHVSPPPANSGYSLRHFNIRKYAVTATDLRAGNKLQSGAWKVFGRN